jgi:hypothetical protein
MRGSDARRITVSYQFVCTLTGVNQPLAAISNYMKGSRRLPDSSSVPWEP